MKKRNIAFVIAGALAIFQTNVVFAKSFEGRESEMNAKCSAVYDSATLAECQQYKEYLSEKSANLDKEIASIRGQVDSIKGDVDKLTNLVSENNAKAAEFDKSIASIQATIDTTQASITKLTTEIEDKQKNIEERDLLMKERIIEMQVYVGSNNFIDFIMGSSSFADLMRRSQIVGELSQYENEQISIISEEKKKLNEDKKVIVNQKELLVLQQQEETNNKAKIEALNAVNKDLIASYHANEASLNAQKIEAQMAQASVKASLPSISTSVIPPELDLGAGTPETPTTPDNGGTDSGESGGGSTDGGNTGGGSTGGGNTGGGSGLSTYLAVPLSTGWHYEAGTWAYPGGGMHLGMDFSTGATMGIPVTAPAAGIVLSSNGGCAQVGGLGVSCGTPRGAGNNVLLAVQLADGSAYVMPFYHLTSNAVSAGQVVKQGDVLGYSGSSGNSSGPHTHVEIISLGNMSLEGIINTWNRNKDFSFGTGWSSPNACGSAPCRLRPENYWLK